ncbi:hypothetical protein GNP61_05335 [Aliivibrio fischeri]|uniref:hypothetical protein n=1 Tax=Aliivibrio fischeri TaxID=668 RepID=UPI0012DAEE5B|nr:hypothetical protein [Aliivibrio fischeri]MUK40979.1 hypothetical protein [Aliivibrio fischeri]
MSIIAKAKAIMINDRYFYDFGKKGQVLTAWSFGGAKLFTYADTLDVVLKKLDEKRKKYQVVDVVVNQPSGVSIKEYYQIACRLQRTMRNIDKRQPMSVHGVAKQISQMSAILALLDNEFSSKELEKIGILVRENAWGWNEKPSLSRRLDFYRQHKMLEKNSNQFCDDIPF